MNRSGNSTKAEPITDWKRRWAKLSIWSLRRHEQLLSWLRMFMWSFSAVLLLAAVVGRVELQTALRLLAFGGLAVVVLLTGMVYTRRNILLSIEDPDLKAEAHRAMLALIRAKKRGRDFVPGEEGRKNGDDASRCPEAGACSS